MRRKPKQVEMFPPQPPDCTAYLAVLAEARRMKRTGAGDELEDYLARQVDGGIIARTDAVAIWRGVTQQYRTPFDMDYVP